MSDSIRTIQSHSAVSAAQARRAADAYLQDTLGAKYRSSHVQKTADQWSFLVQYDQGRVTRPCLVGHVIVDAETGSVVPLSAEQKREMRECAAWETARERGELARDEDGYLLRHQARRLASLWLDAHLSMNFSASDGLFIPIDPPIWQFSIAFDLAEIHLQPLGVIDVDAASGAVSPLTTHQINMLQERMRAVIRHQEPAAAA